MTVYPEPRKEKKPTVTREKWANRSEFYLSCAGGFIGLGNVWRFPYLCYDNGGALFFIPYIIFFIFVGIPIFFLEVCVGQYTSQGGITAWSMLAPITTGIGYGSIILTSVINIYYIVVLGWAIYYMFASFDSNENLIKKWGTCDNPWNDPIACQADVKATTNNSTKALYISPIEEYFEKQVLNSADTMTFETLTNVNWNMVLCVLGGWMLCYFCVWKGVKCTGKVVMFTATFPLFMLTVLVIRGVTLDGASKGIEFYLIPKDFDKLYESKIWVEAGTQILYTFAL